MFILVNKIKRGNKKEPDVESQWDVYLVDTVLPNIDKGGEVNEI
jgi:hypothetical protein